MMAVVGNITKVDPEEIKACLGIQDILLDEGIQFRNGRSRCPIHQGKNSTSFSFNDKTYHCFSCGSAGDLITLVQKVYGFSFWEAIIYLAQKAGLGINTSENIRIRKLKVKSRFDWDRHFEKVMDDAIVFVEKTWTELLKGLDDDLRKGTIDLGRCSVDRRFIEECLEELDEFSIARNWQQKQMRKEINEKRRIRRDCQA